MSPLEIAVIQSAFNLGNPLKNAHQLDLHITNAIKDGADLVLTAECALVGYSLGDILFRIEQQKAIQEAVDYLIAQHYSATVIIGYPILIAGKLLNRASVIQDGKIIANYDKQFLANFRVFDEKRYFTAGTDDLTFKLKGLTIGVYICYDLWAPSISTHINNNPCDVIVSLNASPYYPGKPQERFLLIKQLAKQHNTAIAYANLVGGQDDLVFDGNSFIVNSQGCLAAVAPAFKPAVLIAKYPFASLGDTNQLTSDIDNTANELIEAISLAIKDYVSMCGFSNGALVALSGGIDSAVTLSLAVKALGAEKVEAVYMPSQYNAEISAEDARAQAHALGVRYSVIPIESIYASIEQALLPSFIGLAPDTTEENIQARIRGTLIMALSNKFHKLVLTTGNKSEYAVGYATLYGDMCGGFAPLKDVYKTDVYAMAEMLNQLGYTIPKRVIEREPSAELAPNQLDSNSLPPYDQLDTILRRYIEEELSIDQIAEATGIAYCTIKHVTELVARSEYKRQQSAIGARVSKKSFHKDRRYPIAVDQQFLYKPIKNEN